MITTCLIFSRAKAKDGATTGVGGAGGAGGVADEFGVAVTTRITGVGVNIRLVTVLHPSRTGTASAKRKYWIGFMDIRTAMEW